MRRRDFVKAMVAATVGAKEVLSQQTTPPAAQPLQTLPAIAPKAPGPVPWMRGLMDVKPLPMTPLVPDAVADTVANYFNERQMATFRKLCDILMPPLQGKPGALEAGAPEFLEFLVGASPTDRQQMYLSGLDRLDAEARKKFTASFDTLTAVQVDELIRPMLRTWITDHPPADPFARFINLAHSDIRTATVNSQAWSDAAQRAGQPIPGVDLYWYPIDPELRHEDRASTRRPLPVH